MSRTKEITKESTKESRPPPYSSSADAMKEGVGRNSGTQLLRLRPPLSLRSHSDTSLAASSSAGTGIPTSVVERKSSTA